jgi:hypothetical protein
MLDSGMVRRKKEKKRPSFGIPKGNVLLATPDGRLVPVSKVDLGSEMISVRGAWGSDRRAMGRAGAAAAEGQEARPATNMDPGGS